MEQVQISVQKGIRVPEVFCAYWPTRRTKRVFFVFVHATWLATVAAPLDEVEPVTEKRIGGLMWTFGLFFYWCFNSLQLLPVKTISSEMRKCQACCTQVEHSSADVGADEAFLSPSSPWTGICARLHVRDQYYSGDMANRTGSGLESPLLTVISCVQLLSSFHWSCAQAALWLRREAPRADLELNNVGAVNVFLNARRILRVSCSQLAELQEMGRSYFKPAFDDVKWQLEQRHRRRVQRKCAALSPSLNLIPLDPRDLLLSEWEREEPRQKRSRKLVGD